MGKPAGVLHLERRHRKVTVKTQMGEERKLGVNRGNAGKGRPKGVPNKINALLKDEILQAADMAHEGGRVGYLTAQAVANPTAFLTLLGKVLPTQVEGTGTNGEIVFRTVYETK